MSIAPIGDEAGEHASLPFPAILDPGTNHNFTIHRHYLEKWTDRDLDDEEQFPPTEPVKLRGRKNPAPAYLANLFLHRNHRGTRQLASHRVPFYLELTEGGMIVFDPDPDHPAQPPVPGLRVIRRSRLRVVIDGSRCRVSIRTPAWYDVFGF